MLLNRFTLFAAGTFIIVLLSSAKAVPANNEGLETRIVGGSPTTIQNVPYLVQVWSGNTFICGGTLVSTLFVVSAAHCVNGVQPSQLTIVGGASKLTDTGVRRKVSKIMRPATFSLSNMNNDVAVFKLEAAMTGTNITPISLNTQALRAGMVLKVSGWGVTSENANAPSTIVRTVSVPIVGKAKCSTQYRSVMTLSKTMICASKPGTKDACAGDSGGPAVCNGKLCGIVSWGNGCARRKYPGVYTSVRAVLPMIRKALKT